MNAEIARQNSQLLWCRRGVPYVVDNQGRIREKSYYERLISWIFWSEISEREESLRLKEACRLTLKHLDPANTHEKVRKLIEEKSQWT